MDLTQPWTGYVLPSAVARNPEQPRQYFDAEDLGRLARSMRRKQQVACNVVPYADPSKPEVQWMLVDGERRWRAATMARLERLLVAYNPANAAPSDIFEDSFAANWCRSGHTHSETARAIDKLRSAGKPYEEIAEMVGKTTSWASMEHKLLKLHPDLLALMDPPTPKEQKLPMKVAQLLADLPPFSQQHHWEKVKGMRTSEAFHKLRTSGAGRAAGSRRPKDDREYLLGKCEAAVAAVDALLTAPLQMLKHLTPEAIDAMLGHCAKIRNLSAELQSRLKDAMKTAKKAAA